jgi:hypothetical protein
MSRRKKLTSEERLWQMAFGTEKGTYTFEHFAVGSHIKP